jgi:queuine tRNA-ribosyltransferase
MYQDSDLLEKEKTKTQTKKSKFDFVIEKQSSKNNARLGHLITPHGTIQTPEFIFCATKAAIKAVAPSDMRANGAQFILSNTYHLMIYPGAELIAKFGGLHKFMGWDGPMLTDSGGFQIFSLGHGSVADEIKGKRNNNRNTTLLKITEEGATFRSYLDGSIHTLTPEKAMQVQHNLGADLILVFDECTPFHVERSYTKQSMERSHRWATRSLNEFNRLNNPNQALYGIVQGGIYPDLRQQSCDFVNSNPFFGQAIGGSLGATKQQMYDVVGYTKSLLNPTKPTHLLGIGGLNDIFSGVAQGIDTFDCVHPTRLARHGGALIKAKKHINLSNSIFKLDNQPIEPDCPCSTCQKYSKGYLHYLLKAKELLAYQLITIHNVSFMSRLMAAIRLAIKHDCLAAERTNWI